MARSAFIARREGRYLFRTRFPRCLLLPSRSASIRIALRTGTYAVAARRAARIASWMLRMTAAESPEDALRGLFPKLQQLAVEPVKDEDDLVERVAFQSAAFTAQYSVRTLGLDPDQVVPGWVEYFVALVRENGRASNILERTKTVSGRLELRRHELVAAGQVPVVPPELHPDSEARRLHATIFPALGPGGAYAGLRPAGFSEAAAPDIQHLSMSEILRRLLKKREQDDSDRRAESEIAPIVNFAIALLGDPILTDVKGDKLLKLKAAIPEIPKPFGFAPKDRPNLYFRWKHVQENGWYFTRDGKPSRYKRTSMTTINGGWRNGLTKLWEFGISLNFASGVVPDFYISSRRNPPAAERDAFRSEELLQFFGSARFVGCARRAHPWTPGEYLYQDFFYWCELINLLSGMRPGEIAQLRCRDILDLYGEPHFRYAKFGKRGENESEDDRLDPQPGGNDGKTDAAFRWLPIHWLLLRLGIIERRDAIVADYVAKKINEAGGREKLSANDFAEIEMQAYDLWLFPDWPVYVKNTGEIKWSHYVSKAFTYGKQKLGLTRPGLSQYSGRHTFKGFIDDIKGLSHRSRKILLGHSTRGDVTDGYGPKRISEEQSQVAQNLSNRTIWRLALILIRAKRKAERGELAVIDAWRHDERSGDERFQEALARRAELYR